MNCDPTLLVDHHWRHSVVHSYYRWLKKRSADSPGKGLLSLEASQGKVLYYCRRYSPAYCAKRAPLCIRRL